MGNKYWLRGRGRALRLVIGHKLCGISTYGFSGLWKGDEHPVYPTLRRVAPNLCYQM